MSTYEAACRTYIQALLMQVNQLEADLNETTRVKNLFGKALESIGIFRVNDDGRADSLKCEECEEPKHRHGESGKCPDYKSEGVVTHFREFP